MVMWMRVMRVVSVRIFVRVVRVRFWIRVMGVRFLLIPTAERDHRPENAHGAEHVGLPDTDVHPKRVRAGLAARVPFIFAGDGRRR
jgi:hypothetical protein